MSRCPKCGHDANDSWEFVEFGDSFVAFSVDADELYRFDGITWDDTARPSLWSRIWSKISGRSR